MPVKTKPEALRTLWTLPQRSGATNAHKPFESLFDGSLVLTPHSIIRENDVVMFDGGNDVDPALYGEEAHLMTAKPDKERDKFERWAFKEAQKAGAACLGVCRGAQLLCVLSGGKLVQHVTGHYGGHLIFIGDGQAVYSESSHHQVMWPQEIPHVLIAHASPHMQEPFVVSDEYGKEFEEDKFPEIIFCTDTRSLCIQGHAEFMAPESAFPALTKKLVQDYLVR